MIGIEAFFVPWRTEYDDKLGRKKRLNPLLWPDIQSQNKLGYAAFWGASVLFFPLLTAASIIWLLGQAIALAVPVAFFALGALVSVLPTAIYMVWNTLTNWASYGSAMEALINAYDPVKPLFSGFADFAEGLFNFLSYTFDVFFLLAAKLCWQWPVLGIAKGLNSIGSYAGLKDDYWVEKPAPTKKPTPTARPAVPTQPDSAPPTHPDPVVPQALDQPDLSTDAPLRFDDEPNEFNETPEAEPTEIGPEKEVEEENIESEILEEEIVQIAQKAASAPDYPNIDRTKEVIEATPRALKTSSKQALEVSLAKAQTSYQTGRMFLRLCTEVGLLWGPVVFQSTVNKVRQIPTGVKVMVNYGLYPVVWSAEQYRRETDIYQQSSLAFAALNPRWILGGVTEIIKAEVSARTSSVREFARGVFFWGYAAYTNRAPETPASENQETDQPEQGWVDWGSKKVTGGFSLFKTSVVNLFRIPDVINPPGLLADVTDDDDVTDDEFFDITDGDETSPPPSPITPQMDAEVEKAADDETPPGSDGEAEPPSEPLAQPIVSTATLTN